MPSSEALKIRETNRGMKMADAAGVRPWSTGQAGPGLGLMHPKGVQVGQLAALVTV